MLLSDEKLSETWEYAENLLGFPKAKWKYNDTQNIDLVHSQEVAKAQLIAAHDWMMGKCDKHWERVGNAAGDDEWEEYPKHRYLCPKCRAEFEAEVQKLREVK